MSVTSTVQTRRSRRARRSSGPLVFLRDVAIVIVVALLISFLVKTFLVRSFFIPSGSMEETLQVDDRILVNELVPDLVPISRGDVVVFRDPGGWLRPVVDTPSTSVLGSSAEWLGSLVGLTSPDNDEHLIKRVIGLPGDEVVCCNASGQISVNGVPIKEPYIVIPPGEEKASKIDFSVTVPEGSLWVLGDNRYDSMDSRYNQDKPGRGFVPIDNVVGRAFVVSWPIDRWGGLGDYPSVFQGIPDRSVG